MLRLSVVHLFLIEPEQAFVGMAAFILIRVVRLEIRLARTVRGVRAGGELNAGEFAWFLVPGWNQPAL
jgi:hypothetical protein